MVLSQSAQNVFNQIAQLQGKPLPFPTTTTPQKSPYELRNVITAKGSSSSFITSGGAGSSDFAPAPPTTYVVQQPSVASKLISEINLKGKQIQTLQERDKLKNFVSGVQDPFFTALQYQAKGKIDLYNKNQDLFAKRTQSQFEQLNAENARLTAEQQVLEAEINSLENASKNVDVYSQSSVDAYNAKIESINAKASNFENKAKDFETKAASANRQAVGQQVLQGIASARLNAELEKTNALFAGASGTTPQVNLPGKKPLSQKDIVGLEVGTQKLAVVKPLPATIFGSETLAAKKAREFQPPETYLPGLGEFLSFPEKHTGYEIVEAWPKPLKNLFPEVGGFQTKELAIGFIGGGVGLAAGVLGAYKQGGQAKFAGKDTTKMLLEIPGKTAVGVLEFPLVFARDVLTGVKPIPRAIGELGFYAALSGVGKDAGELKTGLKALNPIKTRVAYGEGTYTGGLDFGVNNFVGSFKYDFPVVKTTSLELGGLKVPLKVTKGKLKVVSAFGGVPKAAGLFLEEGKTAGFLTYEQGFLGNLLSRKVESSIVDIQGQVIPVKDFLVNVSAKQRAGLMDLGTGKVKASLRGRPFAFEKAKPVSVFLDLGKVSAKLTGAKLVKAGVSDRVFYRTAENLFRGGERTPVSKGITFPEKKPVSLLDYSKLEKDNVSLFESESFSMQTPKGIKIGRKPSEYIVDIVTGKESTFKVPKGGKVKIPKEKTIIAGVKSKLKFVKKPEPLLTSEPGLNYPFRDLKPITAKPVETQLEMFVSDFKNAELNYPYKGFKAKVSETPAKISIEDLGKIELNYPYKKLNKDVGKSLETKMSGFVEDLEKANLNYPYKNVKAKAIKEPKVKVLNNLKEPELNYPFKNLEPQAINQKTVVDLSPVSETKLNYPFGESKALAKSKASPKLPKKLGGKLAETKGALNPKLVPESFETSNIVFGGKEKFVKLGEIGITPKFQTTGSFYSDLSGAGLKVSGKVRFKTFSKGEALTDALNIFDVAVPKKNELMVVNQLSQAELQKQLLLGDLRSALKASQPKVEASSFFKQSFIPEKVSAGLKGLFEPSSDLFKGGERTFQVLKEKQGFLEARQSQAAAQFGFTSVSEIAKALTGKAKTLSQPKVGLYSGLYGISGMKVGKVPKVGRMFEEETIYFKQLGEPVKSSIGFKPMVIQSIGLKSLGLQKGLSVEKLSVKELQNQNQLGVTREVLSNKNINKEIEKLASLEIQATKLVNLQVQKNVSKQVQPNALKAIQFQYLKPLQGTVQKQLQLQQLKPLQITKLKLIPPPLIPVIGKPTKGQSKLERAFFVGLRPSAGKAFELLKTVPLTRESALGLGSRIAGRTEKASFQLVETRGKGRNLPGFNLEKFSREFRPSKSKKQSNVFVEKVKYRINEPVEFTNISMKGWTAKRGKKGKKGFWF